MAKKSKKNVKKKLIGLVSVLTGHRIYTTITKETTEPFEKMAYDPKARKHAKYKQTKKNLGRNEVKARKN